MIQEIVCPQSFDLKIKQDDLDVENFPKKLPKNSEKLKIKILWTVKDLMEGVNQWQLLFVSESELRNLAKKASKRGWRKKHKQDPNIIIHTEFDAYTADAAVRTDLSTENFKNGSVSWVNFFLKSKKKWNILIATIYTIAQTKKILLRKEIAENPILAHNFLEFLSQNT